MSRATPPDKPDNARAIDPAPRTYTATVTLLRRESFDTGTLSAQSPPQIEAWLLEEALASHDLLEFYQEFVWRIEAAGIPLVRSSLHVGTLHPQLFGYAWMWNTDDGFCDEIIVDQSVLASDAYRRNPLYQVIEKGERFRVLLDPSSRNELGPLLSELAGQGITEYAALPLRSGSANHNAATVATRQPGGFTAEQFAQVERLLHVFALHVDRHIAERISENIVTTYLGRDAGRMVLDGSIKRGSGTAIDAVIWVSDLRGFTQLADNLDEIKLTEILDAYFDCIASAVIDHGGDVLKFIGDGLLAVFPFKSFPNDAAAAEAAISAAQGALDSLDQLNAEPGALADSAGWKPLHTGIALHRGEAFFGNVGAPNRLDFTVIGKAVNAASRVEGLCKTTGRPLLLTAPVAELSSRQMESLGSFDMAGLEQPLEVFTLR